MDLDPWDPLDHPARIEVRRQESDDSDAEGGLGNVTRVVLRPPGHSGKAKRGHLCFDASYECGNLGRVDFISEYEYDLFIRPDTCNPRYRLWFNFVVDNVRADQRVVFNIVNLCKVKTLFRDGMTPLVKTSSRPKWQRLPGKYVYYHKSPEHRNHYILSFAFAFDREEDVYQFAFSFPFSYSRCQAHLELVEQKELPFFKRETISLSLQNRKLDVITISNGTGGGNSGKKPKLVVIMARSHPGESPTSFIIQGLIDFLVSSHGMPGALRDHVVIKIIPMINPDGVFLGNYRCSLMGYDLNRHWNQVSPWAHPTLHAIKNFLLELDASRALELDMVIDVHAHSSLMGAFIYGNSYDDVYRFERHILFPKLLAHNAEDFSSLHTMYNRDPSKSGSARRHLCEILKNTVNVYTMEVSFLGYQQQSTNTTVTYNEDGYFRLGRNLVRTLFEYYRVTGIIPANIFPPPNQAGTAQQETEGKKIQRRSRSRSRSQTRGMTSGQKQPKSRSKARKSKSTESSSGILPARQSQNPTVNSNSNPTAKGNLRGGASEASTSRTFLEPGTGIRRNSTLHSGQSVSQEKAVVELTQLTLEKDDDSSESSEDSCFNPQPNKQRYERNKKLREEEAEAAKANANVNANVKAKDEIGNGSQVRSFQTRVPMVTRTDSKDDNTMKKDSRLKRKSIGVRNQIRERTGTAVYKTFDFSAIRDASGHAILGRRSARNRRTSGLSKRCGLVTGRKVGGGGIIGKKPHFHIHSHHYHHHHPLSYGHVRRTHPRPNVAWHSEPEADAPCLTIIDFSKLIRKGVLEGGHGGGGGSSACIGTGGGGGEGAWKKGLKINKRSSTPYPHSHSSSGQPQSSFQGSSTKTFLGIINNPNKNQNQNQHPNPNPSCSNTNGNGKGANIRGILGTSHSSRRHSHNHYVRRRKAVLLRGTVTDCSPWEDSNDDCLSSDDLDVFRSPSNHPVETQSHPCDSVPSILTPISSTVTPLPHCNGKGIDIGNDKDNDNDASNINSNAAPSQIQQISVPSQTKGQARTPSPMTPILLSI